MPATAVSDWPTPTVSTSTTSKPAASTHDDRLAGRAGDAAEAPAVGDGRMNACVDAARRAIRVLSPRMLPPVRLDVGSTASTATRWPLVDEVACRRRR